MSQALKSALKAVQGHLRFLNAAPAILQIPFTIVPTMGEMITVEKWMRQMREHFTELMEAHQRLLREKPTKRSALPQIEKLESLLAETKQKHRDLGKRMNSLAEKFAERVRNDVSWGEFIAEMRDIDDMPTLPSVVTVPLHDTAQRAAEYIQAHPGSHGKQIAKACGDITPAHFRRLFREKLRPRGYWNASPGYYPPKS